MGRRWLVWAAGAMTILWMLTPGGNYLLMLPWGRWVVMLTGVVLGFSLAGWWGAIGETETELLRHRLVRGEIRLSEYRLLCRELGIDKKNLPTVKKEEEFSPADGT